MKGISMLLTAALLLAAHLLALHFKKSGRQAPPRPAERFSAKETQAHPVTWTAPVQI